MKGKYASRSALRREDTEVRSEISGYQHHVQRLTAENKELKEVLDSERAQHKQEAQRLRAMLDEGLSPEVLALREELERQRERAEAAKTACHQIEQIWDKTISGLRRLLQDGLGLRPQEVLELLVGINALPVYYDGKPHSDLDKKPIRMLGLPGEPGVVTSQPRAFAGFTREQIVAIQAARGLRSRADIVKLLCERMAAVEAEAAP